MLAGIILQPSAWDSTQGRLDDVLISSNTLKNVTTPLQVSVHPGNAAGRITVERLDAIGVYKAACAVESWADDPIEHFVMRDVSIEYTGGGKRSEASSKIPKPGLDARRLQNWALFARDVKRLSLEDVRFRCSNKDYRHAVVMRGVEDLEIEDVRFPILDDAAAPVVLRNVNQVKVENVSEKIRAAFHDGVENQPELDVSQDQ